VARSDLSSLALDTRPASGLSQARPKYVFILYRDLAYISLKFIRVPKNSLRPNDIEEGIDRFDRDMFLKIHFAEDDEDDNPTRNYK